MGMNSVLDGWRVRRLAVIQEEIVKTGLKLINDKWEVFGNKRSEKFSFFGAEMV